MLETLCRVLPDYVLLFACFSIAGWMMEVVLKYIQYHRFINRGFLIGPYCPIYGWGALLITLVAGGRLLPRFTVGETFLTGFFLCGTLEYLVSWWMEKTSHARWWDYSSKPMNLNGRVWIGNLLLFGAAAVGIVFLADPPLFGLFGRMSETARLIAACVFLAILWADRIASHFLVRILRDCIDRQQADDTEAIRLEMQRMLKDRALLVRRIEQAYPELQPRPGRLTARLKAARAEYRAAVKRLRAELRAAERTLHDHRRQTSQELLGSLQARVRDARASMEQTRAKLRKVEDDLFGHDR